MLFLLWFMDFQEICQLVDQAALRPQVWADGGGLYCLHLVKMSFKFSTLMC